MSRKEKSRIDTSGGNSLGGNLFGSLGGLSGLDAASLPQAAAAPASGVKADEPAQAVTGSGAGVPKKLGRLDVRWEKSGRGGKVVTLIGGEGFASADVAVLDDLLHMLKNRLGCGGTRDGQILELQGKRIEQVGPLLTQLGYRVVRTGG